VPVSAADSGTMLYNGVELPDIESVWTNKENYPAVSIYRINDTSEYRLRFAKGWLYNFQTTYNNHERLYVMQGDCYRYSLVDGEWVLSALVDNNDAPIANSNNIVIWANTNLYTDSSLTTPYFITSAPVDPNAPVESPVMDILSTTADSSSIHTNFNVSGISSDSLYTIIASCFSGEQVVGSSAVGPYSGPEFQATVSVGGLSPSTEYTVEYQLSKDGEYTGVSQTVTVTTAAASGSGSGDGTGDNSGSCACPSILNSILSAITAQTNLLSTWQQTWTTRMDSLESTLSKLIPVPDPTETALKESADDATKEVTDSLFADDAPTKVTASDVKDVAEIGSAASSMFDSGVSVSSFFDAINDISLIALFTEKSKNDIYAVNEITTYGIDSGNQVVDYYTENLNKIKEFVGGDS